MNWLSAIVFIGIAVFLVCEIVGLVNDIRRRIAKKKEQNTEPNEVNESENEND